MSEESKKVKSKTDSKLFLNNANHCDWKILKNESCAGANAASRADMTLATTDPLSEIVWSPEKGLSLKYADSSFADKNSYLFRDVGPSSCMVLSQPQVVTYSNSVTDKPIDDVFVKSIAITCVKPDYRADEEINIGEGSGVNEKKVSTAERASNFSDDHDQANIGTDNITGIKAGQVDQKLTDNLILQPDEPKPIIEQNSSLWRHSNEGIDIDTENKLVETSDDLKITVEPIVEYKGSGARETNLTSSSRNPLEKLEFSAENDLRNVEPIVEPIVKKIQIKSEDNEMTPVFDKALAVMHSPCNSEICMAKRKGKKKSISDEDAYVRLSMDNDSQSSVESCNSARFISTGKKRRNFQNQQLIIGSKRVKNNAEETSGSKSYIKQESSFKNWISSMVKGLSQSNQNDSNTLSVGLVNLDHHNDRSDEKLTACNMNQHHEPKNTGFKSIFQSMYCPSLKNVGTRMFHQEDCEPSNMVEGIAATPITCFPDNRSLAERYFQSNKFEESTGRYDACPSQPNIEPLNYFNSYEIGKNNPVENKNCSNLDLSKDKDEMASNSSSTRQNTKNTDNVDSNAPSERKEAEDVGQRTDNLGSLWINRFALKSAAPLLNDASSSPGFTNSERMASSFGRRFLGIKHTMPTNKAECTSQVNMFCLFCGTRGHQLGDCSAVAESELEDLQKNVKSYEGLENFPIVCIKCFQLNHWAISCATPGQTNEVDKTVHDGIDHETDQYNNLTQKSNDIVNFQIECNASFKKDCDSRSKENKFKDKPIVTPPSILGESKISHVPVGIFDAVKKLQLSRTDILKWITAHGSISHLDGFFLRLRLGKWEEGLGGTKYHVAYINETKRHSLEQHTGKSITVKVRGIKCTVESHYISNHDFLEEEIMEWWSATTERGVEIPSEEELIAKLKKKQILGL